MHHPFHIHGAGRFLVLSRDGEPEANLVWKDTVLLRAGQTVDILLDVSNPGLWMAHCHIAEHTESGMMFSFTVARTPGVGPMTAGPPRAPLDVLVIGGGQAGLAMGYHAMRRGLRFRIVDSGPEIGSAWRSRWDSLQLFTSGRYDNLPGLPFPAAADSYPGKDDVADYLQAYAAEFELPVRLGHDRDVAGPRRRRHLHRQGRCRRRWRPGQVVVATGPFQVPFTPPVAAGLSPDVQQVHSADYRRPGAAAARAGARRRGRELRLPDRPGTVRDPDGGPRRRQADPRPCPQRPLGRDVWWWASRLRLDRVTADSRLGRRLAGRDQIVGAGPRQLARRHGVTAPAPGRAASRRRDRRLRRRHPRPTTTSSCGRPASPWTTRGSTSRTPPTSAGGCGSRVESLRRPGLYTLGRTWQHTRGSALLGWVGDDAAFLADMIAGPAR